MPRPRTNIRVVLLVIATAWAMLMSFFGAWLWMHDPHALRFSPSIKQGLALSACSGGLFLFMTLVADRLFPRAQRTLASGLELLALAAFVAGLCWPVLDLISQGAAA